jgi:hypothetical protein
VATATSIRRALLGAGGALAVAGSCVVGAHPAAATVPVAIPIVAPQLPTDHVVVPLPDDQGKGIDVTIAPGGVHLNGNVPVPPPPELSQPSSNPPTASDPSSQSPVANPVAGTTANASAPAAARTPVASAAAPAASRGTAATHWSAPTSVDAPRVTGALRPVPRHAGSTIGVAAATIGPWIVLFLLALVLRTAALALLRDRLRENRAVS